MKVTHSYIAKSQDVVGITSDNGLPRNFTMYGTRLWKRCDWGWVGSADFEQNADVGDNADIKPINRVDPVVVIEQSLAIEVLNKGAISILRSYSEACDLVAAHFTDDGRCFFQGIDFSPIGGFVPKSSRLSTRLRMRKAIENDGHVLAWADLKGKTAILSPMLLPGDAMKMETILKAL